MTVRKRVRPEADDQRKGAQMSGDIQEGKVEFFLTRSFDYTPGKGQTEKATHLVLQEHGMEHLGHWMQMRQMVTRAMTSMALKFKDQEVPGDSVVVGQEVKGIKDVDAEEYGQESKEAEEAINMALMMADDVDASEFVEIFGKMVVTNKGRSICLVDGVVPMTSSLWLKMKPEDAYNAAVRWAAFFAMPDALANNE